MKTTSTDIKCQVTRIEANLGRDVAQKYFSACKYVIDIEKLIHRDVPDNVIVAALSVALQYVLTNGIPVTCRDPFGDAPVPKAQPTYPSHEYMYINGNYYRRLDESIVVDGIRYKRVEQSALKGVLEK